MQYYAIFWRRKIVVWFFNTCRTVFKRTQKVSIIMAASSIRGVTIFYCYASADEKHLRELDKHLQDLKRLGQVTTWYDRQIRPGTEWEAEIEARLNSADIILLLVSPDFMQSDFCYNVEMRRALERHNSPEKTEVIPIILRPVNWQDTPIGKLQAWPIRGKPITLWDHRDEGYQNAADGIKQTVSSLLTAQWKDQARSYYMLGMYENALEAYDEALRLKFENADIQRDRGHVLLKLGRFNEALDAYDKAIQLKPKEALFYIHKGNAFRQMQRPGEAVVAYDQALRLDPDNPSFLIHKGYALLDIQRPTEALACFEQALQFKPDSGQGYVGQGRALEMLGQTSEAEMAYQKAQSLGQ
jgi:tetratricopeptide (TPR) repeat protein